MSTPLVSVVVPLFDSAPTIERTLRSLQQQSLRGWRAWVVDDASRDDGPAVVDRLARDDDRIRLVRRRVNAGLAGARNTGLEACRDDPSSFVHVLDADDWMAPDGLERLVEGCARTGAACASYEFVDARGRALDLLCHPPAEGVTLDHLLDRNRFASHAHLLRRDVLADLRFDDSLRRCEDYDLWLRLATRGVRWATVPGVVASYRLRPAGLSRDFVAMLSTLRGVVASAFSRARAAGLPTADSDRESAVLARFSLEFATMESARSHERALALLEPAAINPCHLADAAYWGAILGLGRSPLSQPGLPDPSWLASTLAWWDRLRTGGRVDDDDLAKARDHLARALVLDRDIADACLDHVHPGARIVIVGCGRNGMVLAQRATARGLTIEVRDDRTPLAGYPTAPVVAPLREHDAVIVTPCDDRTLIPRVPSRAVRWSLVREDLALRLRAAMEPATSPR